MLLVMDVGNTNIVIGVYEGRKLRHHWRVHTDRDKTEDEYGMLIRALFDHAGLSFSDIEAVVIGSVVPPLMSALERMARKYIGREAMVVGPGIKTGVNIKTENPKEVGADRIINVVAALHLYKPPLIIVDFGTATTFDVIDARGDMIGTAIAPGLVIAAEALFQKAAKLPRIEIARPPHVVGRNTVTAMQSGVYFGYVALVDGLVARIRRELKAPATVVATGGLAELVAAESETIDIVNPFLTLQGLQLLYERNR
ncbi:type III pantothenate kinase [Calditerricola satsumensis]|uniref:Type III pantothenate kinase n=2 Tax=Calditerricola satsumensis TaxID=373054 RepID=A0A8J3BBE6_9BACI|nr:type III pantothenate kinase [Calditerricola satsumensis]GGK06933.1 type III pantothenate kinase [Calditerricola satsumensis]